MAIHVHLKPVATTEVSKGGAFQLELTAEFPNLNHASERSATPVDVVEPGDVGMDEGADQLEPPQIGQALRLQRFFTLPAVMEARVNTTDGTNRYTLTKPLIDALKEYGFVNEQQAEQLKILSERTAAPNNGMVAMLQASGLLKKSGRLVPTVAGAVAVR